MGRGSQLPALWKVVGFDTPNSSVWLRCASLGQKQLCAATLQNICDALGRMAHVQRHIGCTSGEHAQNGLHEAAVARHT